MKTHFLFYFICFALIGCKHTKDELAFVEFGKVPHEKFINEWLTQGFLSEPESDSTTFRYYLYKTNLDSIPVTIQVNPDGYKFGNVRQIKIDLGGDTVFWSYQPSYARRLGARLRDEVDNIYTLYTKWHGQPDSIITFGKKRETERMQQQTNDTIPRVDLSKLPVVEIQYHQDERPFNRSEQIYKAYWDKGQYSIDFIFSMPTMDFNFDNRLVYEKAYILYEMKDYSREFNRIQDSIRKTFTANDIINITASNPKWEILQRKSYLDHDRRFQITLSDIKRKDREEPRGVVAIRFDVVLEDRFGKELYRMEDVTYEPQRTLYGSYGSNFIISPYTFEQYEIRYHSISRHAEELEQARVFSQNNRVSARAIINAVVFQDGHVLR